MVAGWGLVGRFVANGNCGDVPAIWYLISSITITCVCRRLCE